MALRPPSSSKSGRDAARQNRRSMTRMIVDVPVAVVVVPPGGAAGYAGDADRRERPSDPGLCCGRWVPRAAKLLDVAKHHKRKREYKKAEAFSAPDGHWSRRSSKLVGRLNHLHPLSPVFDER